MLNEGEVIDAVCQCLEQSGYRILTRCTVKQQGIDIVAEHVASKAVLRVEAKGETSTNQASKRFGHAFSSAQVRTHVAEAFYAAAAMLDPTGPRVAVALPETSIHRKQIEQIAGAMRALNVAVFWVAPDRTVTVESARPLE
jgi:Holliday junction resolvase-like predicted endonuclease